MITKLVSGGAAANSFCPPFLFSREPQLYKSVFPSVGPLVRWSVGNAFVSAGRDEPANDLFRVYELVKKHLLLQRALSRSDSSKICF